MAEVSSPVLASPANTKRKDTSALYVLTGENDAKTLRVDANSFENGEKNVAFSKEYGYV